VTDAPGLTFVLAAGGTGGHLFPAEALARELVRQGGQVHLATDRRADAFAEKVPGVAVCQVRAGRFGGGPLHLAYGVAEMALGIVQARRLLHRLMPDVVVGFGGYASVPTMLAASQRGIPTVIHEQNAVLGRANRLLAPRASRIATGFAETTGLRAADGSRAVHTGNPVRPAILAVAATAYAPPAPGEPIELLILGGSQGARIFSDLVPPTLAALPEEIRSALRVSQQARPEDRDRVVGDLQAAGIAAEVETFFNDVPARLARAHLVICRSGASTISELAATGRPALLVPYPHAMDDHQAANAQAFAAAGAGWTMPQSSLTAPVLTERLTELLRNGPALSQAAAQARHFGRDDAAERLAALTIALAPLVDGAKKRRAA
jgi:UDP-N-acetylglucosamine--N-acetylmuramyl-(pentapeptide) pyrophosphoryl-undecaprenol N-acetylglucosamine transferase